MPVLDGIGVLATCTAADGGPAPADIRALDDAAVAWRGDTIVWAGPRSRLPGEFAAEPRLDAGGRLVVPGLIDCHTHLAFGGWRADEFRARIEGRSYLEIARAGGGIASTVRATRAMAEGDLLARARSFLDAMVSRGVTTVECKSGYGLDLESELRLLDVYRRLDDEGPARIVATCLAAHVVPPEFREDRGAYISLVCEAILPAVAERGLARFCDVFVEDSAFTAGEARAIFATARELGLGAKLHADQLTGGAGAELAADVGAVSADHLEAVSERGIARMAEAGVVAVTLPIATLYLNQDPPPARAMIDAGVAVAVATDFNPGTAPSFELPLAMLLACTRQRMTPAEVLLGVTRLAARAIGREADLGSIEPGKLADLAVIDAGSVDEWMYHYAGNRCAATIVGGRVVAGRLDRT